MCRGFVHNAGMLIRRASRLKVGTPNRSLEDLSAEVTPGAAMLAPETLDYDFMAHFTQALTVIVQEQARALEATQS